METTTFKIDDIVSINTSDANLDNANVIVVSVEKADQDKEPNDSEYLTNGNDGYKYYVQFKDKHYEYWPSSLLVKAENGGGRKRRRTKRAVKSRRSRRSAKRVRKTRR